MAIADKQARLLRCIEEPTRLRILTLLAEGEKYVGEIAAALGKEQSLVLYHLRALRKCNIVTVNPQSPEVYYKLSDARLAELVNTSKVVLKDIFAVRPKENPNRKVDKLE